MQFTIAESGKKADKKDYQISRIDTVARWFLWSKVQMDGKRFDKHSDYVKALGKLKPADYKRACDYATKLAADSHAKKAAKVNGPKL